MPNIEGEITSSTCYIFYRNGATGAFEIVGTNGVGPAASKNNDGNNRLAIDASRSNSIYGNSTTVTPLSISHIPCIKAY